MKAISIIFFCTILTGCAVPVNFYFLNTTSNTVEIKARPQDPEASGGNLSLRYKEKILEVKYNLHKSLDKALLPKAKQGDYLIYTLPPNSTLFIGKGLNFKNFSFDKIIIIDQGEIVDSLAWKNIENLNTGSDFLNRHFAWYAVD